MAQVEKNRVALATRVALYLRQRPIACFAFALVTGLVLGSVGLGMLFAGGVARDGFASADGVEIRRDVDSDKGTDIDSGDTDETEADGAGADGETGDSLDVRSCPRARLRADLHREMARRRRETEMRVAPS